MRGRLGTPAGNRALSAAQRQYDNETPEDDEEAEDEVVEEGACEPDSLPEIAKRAWKAIQARAEKADFDAAGRGEREK